MSTTCLNAQLSVTIETWLDELAKTYPDDDPQRLLADALTTREIVKAIFERAGFAYVRKQENGEA